MAILKLIHILAILCLTLVPPTRGQAQDSAQDRIDAITGQRATANRAGKSVCFLMMGADRGLLEKAALTSIHTFESTNSALLNGGHNSGFAPETDPAIRQQIQAMNDVVSPVMLSARQLVAGDLHPVPMHMFLDGINRTDQSLDAVTMPVLDRYPTTQSGRQSVVLIQHQNALIQGMLRDACLLQVGTLGQAGRARLIAHMELFEANLAALLEGDAKMGIPPPPSITIKVTLEKMGKNWVRIKPVIEASLNNEDVTMKQFQKASIFGDLIGKYVVKMRDYYWKA